MTESPFSLAIYPRQLMFAYSIFHFFTHSYLVIDRCVHEYTPSEVFSHFSFPWQQNPRDQVRITLDHDAQYPVATEKLQREARVVPAEKRRRSQRVKAHLEQLGRQKTKKNSQPPHIVVCTSTHTLQVFSHFPFPWQQNPRDQGMITPDHDAEYPVAPKKLERGEGCSSRKAQTVPQDRCVHEYTYSQVFSHFPFPWQQNPRDQVRITPDHDAQNPVAPKKLEREAMGCSSRKAQTVPKG
ncbi:hypothetical protein CDAR_531721 [Caerostris darwini]|uniref:Uncharacterized protein n=1 Tax=Caerostris darwini TaxID=1538125 RepID=A0AAV4QDF1_9ARAC|nr:hypothetical protein CDAR_531721 [Caerostris darwini]